MAVMPKHAISGKYI